MSRGLKWTEEELREHYTRLKLDTPVVGTTADKPKRPQPKRGVMNKTEECYARFLDVRKLVGEVKAWHFERMTFVLAPRNGKIPAVRYTPDFSVVMPNGKIRITEIKAGRKRKSGAVRPHFEDGARERLQWAAREFPEYEWSLAWQWKQMWEEEVL